MGNFGSLSVAELLAFPAIKNFTWRFLTRHSTYLLAQAVWSKRPSTSWRRTSRRRRTRGCRSSRAHRGSPPLKAAGTDSMYVTQNVRRADDIIQSKAEWNREFPRLVCHLVDEEIISAHYLSTLPSDGPFTKFRGQFKGPTFTHVHIQPIMPSHPASSFFYLKLSVSELKCAAPLTSSISSSCSEVAQRQTRYICLKGPCPCMAGDREHAFASSVAFACWFPFVSCFTLISSRTGPSRTRNSSTEKK